MFRFYKICSWPNGTYVDVGGLVTFAEANDLLDGLPLEQGWPLASSDATTSEYLIYEG